MVYNHWFGRYRYWLLAGFFKNAMQCILIVTLMFVLNRLLFGSGRFQWYLLLVLILIMCIWELNTWFIHSVSADEEQRQIRLRLYRWRDGTGDIILPFETTTVHIGQDRRPVFNKLVHIIMPTGRGYILDLWQMKRPVLNRLAAQLAALTRPAATSS